MVHRTNPTLKEDLTPDRRFDLATEGDCLVYVAGRFVAANEGSVSARLTIPPGVLVRSSLTPTAPFTIGAKQAVLRPGEELTLDVVASRPVADWAALAGNRDPANQEPLSCTILVQDNLADGVQDRTDLYIRALPFVQLDLDTWGVDPLENGRFQRDVIQTGTSQTVRTYRGEDTRAPNQWRR